MCRKTKSGRESESAEYAGVRADSYPAWYVPDRLAWIGWDIRPFGLITGRSAAVRAADAIWLNQVFASLHAGFFRGLLSTRQCDSAWWAPHRKLDQIYRPPCPDAEVNPQATAFYALSYMVCSLGFLDPPGNRMQLQEYVSPDSSIEPCRARRDLPIVLAILTPNLYNTQN